MKICKAKTNQIAPTALFLGIFALIFFRLPLHFTRPHLLSSSFPPADSADLRKGEGWVRGQYWSDFFSDALEDSGLEARDAQNRIIRSAKARFALKELFVLKAFKLLVEEDLPSISSIRKVLGKLINPFSAAFDRTIHFFESAVKFALGMTSRFFPADKSWGVRMTLSSHLTTLPLYHLRLTTDRYPQNLPLRC